MPPQRQDVAHFVAASAAAESSPCGTSLSKIGTGKTTSNFVLLLPRKDFRLQSGRVLAVDDLLRRTRFADAAATEEEDRGGGGKLRYGSEVKF